MKTSTQTSSGRGRPREFDTQAVLDKAIKQFSEYGYHGTSISDLNKCLGLTSGSIYKAWGDKHGLFLAALERYLAVRSEAIAACVASEPSARHKLQALLAHYAMLSAGELGRTGCLVVESAVELSRADPEVAGVIAAQQARREILLRRLVEEGQADGSLAKSLDAVHVARLLLAMQQGMRVLGKTGADAATMQGAVAEMITLLT